MARRVCYTRFGSRYFTSPRAVKYSEEFFLLDKTERNDAFGSAGRGASMSSGVEKDQVIFFCLDEEAF